MSEVTKTYFDFWTCRLLAKHAVGILYRKRELARFDSLSLVLRRYLLRIHWVSGYEIPAVPCVLDEVSDFRHFLH